jgi:hypothetical protein
LYGVSEVVHGEDLVGDPPEPVLGFFDEDEGTGEAPELAGEVGGGEDTCNVQAIGVAHEDEAVGVDGLDLIEQKRVMVYDPG